jgi:hypothetical protein
VSRRVYRIATHILIIFATATSFAAKKTSSATVTGEGDSYWDARQDCIRQALQQAVAQLVVADRRIENDKLVKDSILSTMNGFVDSFEVIKQTSERGRVQLVAQVTVSVSGIENFVLSSGKGSAKFDSNAVLGNLQKDDLMRVSNSEIVTRLFEGFPSRAFDVQVKKIAPDPQNRGIVLVTIDIRANKQFIRNLRSGLRVIGHLGRYNYQAPDLLEVCFDSSESDLGNYVPYCITVDVDVDLLHQQMFGKGGFIPFALWFSPAAAEPFVEGATYLRLLPYPIPKQSGYMEMPGYIGTVVFESRSFMGQLRGGSIHITEATRTFVIRIPRSTIPDGTKEIHALPLFSDANNQGRVLLDLFRPGISIESPEFKQFVRSAIGVR